MVDYEERCRDFGWRFEAIGYKLELIETVGREGTISIKIIVSKWDDPYMRMVKYYTKTDDAWKRTRDYLRIVLRTLNCLA